MFSLLATTQASCRRSFPRHLRLRSTILAVIAVSAVVLQAVHPQAVWAESGKRPNLIFIMADDKCD